MPTIHIFYKDDINCKNTDIFFVDKSTSDNIAKQIKNNEPYLTFVAGTVSAYQKEGYRKYGVHIIDYDQYIRTDSLAKIIIDDINS